MKTLATLALLASAGGAMAACPDAPDIDDAQARLFTLAQQAQSEAEAQPITQELWRLWATAPDATAQALLDQGMNARGSWDFLTALEAFDRLVGYCPDYAEGYNQRAFVHFLRQDYAAALIDLDLALARSPNHVAALSGKALTLIGLDRQDEAQEVLRRALALNPWIPERGLLQAPDVEL